MRFGRFSFGRTAVGTVGEVLYSRMSSPEGVMWKKAVASLFSMSLQVMSPSLTNNRETEKYQGGKLTVEQECTDK